VRKLKKTILIKVILFVKGGGYCW